MKIERVFVNKYLSTKQGRYPQNDCLLRKQTSSDIFERLTEFGQNAFMDSVVPDYNAPRTTTACYQWPAGDGTPADERGGIVSLRFES